MSEKYFLGVMTENGFSTEINKMIAQKDFYTYILKGGAGTGKSSLMKKIANEFEPFEDVTRYYCSSDPNSLDAVMLNGSKVIICDGTSPHTADPVFPGACQTIVNLGEFWDENMLRANRDKIVDVTTKNKNLLALAKNYQTALTNVNTGIYNMGAAALDDKKLSAFVSRLCKKLFHGKKAGKGKVSYRRLSAVTEYGLMNFTETLENYLDVYALNDNLFVCTDRFIELMKEQAASRGYDVKICRCGLLGNKHNEHLLIDELGIAFVAGYVYDKNIPSEITKINLGRFYDKNLISESRMNIKCARNMADELLKKSAQTIKAAKKVHDEIEDNYIGAMDFDGLNMVCNQLITKIRSGETE